MAFNRAAYMKEYHKKWYEANKERLLTSFKQYAADHADALVAYKKDWYDRNRSHLIGKAKNRYREVKTTSRLAYNLKTLYGLSVERYRELMVKQNGVCAICKGRSERRLSVDHNHATGKVRGLLCRRCNFAIGLLRENRSNLEAAILYLEEPHE